MASLTLGWWKPTIRIIIHGPKYVYYSLKTVIFQHFFFLINLVTILDACNGIGNVIVHSLDRTNVFRNLCDSFRWYSSETWELISNRLLSEISNISKNNFFFSSAFLLFYLSLSMSKKSLRLFTWLNCIINSALLFTLTYFFIYCSLINTNHFSLLCSITKFS